jgi:hypothetical protein
LGFFFVAGSVLLTLPFSCREIERGVKSQNGNMAGEGKSERFSSEVLAFPHATTGGVATRPIVIYNNFIVSSKIIYRSKYARWNKMSTIHEV